MAKKPADATRKSAIKKSTANTIKPGVAVKKKSGTAKTVASAKAPAARAPKLAKQTASKPETKPAFEINSKPYEPIITVLPEQDQTITETPSEKNDDIAL